MRGGRDGGNGGGGFGILVTTLKEYIAVKSRHARYS